MMRNNSQIDVVTNVRVYDLEESMIASGYPMRTDVGELGFEATPSERDVSRCVKLSNMASEQANGAHEQFLTGIIVSFDLTFSNKAWVEAERYRFLNFVSSESSMHRITKFDIAKQCNEYVDPRIVSVLQEYVERYNKLEDAEKRKEQYLRILYNIPSGFRLTARMTTNYRCLKNIYHQRKDHRLPEWRKFCGWIETLPYAKELLLTDK